jgi:tripeptide aminopeptidase
MADSYANFSIQVNSGSRDWFTARTAEARGLPSSGCAIRIDTMSVLDRFLRYVTIDTRSDERSTSCPSTPGQLELMRMLEAELQEVGAADVAIDEHGYLMATIPATTSREVPTIGFIAHVDTSPEMPGAGVHPLVHPAYDGRDLVLPDDPAVVLRPSEDPALAARIGDDIVTASGLTLLGADDKAGVAAIVTAAEYLLRHPKIPHGTIRIAFTPDEEIGRGADRFDVPRFGAACAYTLDGGSRGELEYESFSADAMTLTFNGFNTHPGYAKGRMVNAIRMAAAFIDRLPAAGMSPETTDGYEGFVHPYQLDASVDRTRVKVLIRDFATAALKEKEALVERIARQVAGHAGASVDVRIEECYRNMREVLDRHPRVIDHAREAMRRVGIEPIEKPIRGGTDGSRLSFMGLPTPNLFAGEHNFHSRLEWVSVQDMEKAVEVIVQLAQVWAEGANLPPLTSTA